MDNDENVCQPSTSKRIRFDRKRPLTDCELLRILEDSEDEFELVDNEESDEDSDTETENDLVQTNDIVEAVPSGDTIGRLWLNEAPEVVKIHYSGVSGLKCVMDSHHPIDYFNLLFNDNFYELIVQNSNAYAVEILANSTSEQSRIAAWKDVTKEEFKIFLGLLYHMGTIKINRINDYWKTNFLFNIPVFSACLSRNRFLLILRALHLTTNETEEQSRLAKILPLIDFFNTRMTEIYYPSRELSIDESIVLWRGRLSFRQYIPGKRHKYGIKLYVLAEPTGMAQKLLVYAGSADLDTGGPGHTEKVVLKLLDGKLSVGHAVYMDNFYNSVSLSEKLLHAKTYTTGTLRANRGGNPKNVTSKKLRKGQSFCEYTQEKVCVCKWKDRRDVLAISTEFDGEMIQGRSKRGLEQTKPRLVLEYNKYMGGVDRSDQMLNYYSCEHKTLRWYKKLAIHLFQIMLTNSYFLYNKYEEKKMNLYDFRMSIISSLLVPPTPKKEKQKLVNHLPEYCPKDNQGNAKRRRCKYCYQTKKIRKDSVYFCPQCPKEPGLCLTPCFRNFHEL